MPELIIYMMIQLQFIIQCQIFVFYVFLWKL